MGKVTPSAGVKILSRVLWTTEAVQRTTLWSDMLLVTFKLVPLLAFVHLLKFTKSMKRGTSNEQI